MNRAKKILSMMEKDSKFKSRGPVYFYRVEGLIGGKWSLIFRTRDLVIASTAADEYRDKYWDDVRIMRENPDGSVAPIKGRE